MLFSRKSFKANTKYLLSKKSRTKLINFTESDEKFFKIFGILIRLV